ncbi:prepilin-type N-terminal cleavage/methylation domain-containing protein [Alphaproteobacteria bacterium]|jgi:prepilin-type N-terminal cleavage/methylation domain-containing protein|nr:prepilin-type N-terminal cleavage/methylation domain-containing protein [Alphaproteobacteria bacterium]
MNSRYQNGFTVLEFLVALTILSLVSILLLSGLQTGIVGSNQISRKLDNIETFESLDRSFRNSMKSLLPIKISDIQGSKVHFSGGKNNINFLNAGEEGPRRHSISSTPDDTILFTQGVLKKTLKTFIIGPHSFQFFGKINREPAPRWHNTWFNQTNTPRLVRLSIENYPPITVRLPKRHQSR